MAEDVTHTAGSPETEEAIAGAMALLANILGTALCHIHGVEDVEFALIAVGKLDGEETTLSLVSTMDMATLTAALQAHIAKQQDGSMH